VQTLPWAASSAAAASCSSPSSTVTTGKNLEAFSEACDGRSCVVLLTPYQSALLIWLYSVHVAAQHLVQQPIFNRYHWRGLLLVVESMMCISGGRGSGVHGDVNGSPACIRVSMLASPAAGPSRQPVSDPLQLRQLPAPAFALASLSSRFSLFSLFPHTVSTRCCAT
jgi:hypothetical protein